jgi:hypothetical protein
MPRAASRNSNRKEEGGSALLPAREQQERLADGLSRLVERGGDGPFLTNPIVLPTPANFPDPIPRTVGELRRLIGTLLAYAGLGDLGVEIHLYDSKRPYRVLDDEGRERPPPHEGAAAYFAGISRGVCQFGLDLATLGDAERVLGILAHEVAHAYREHHRLTVMTRQTEEELTDLTTVYLGFGVLTLNASYVSRSSGRLVGSMVTHSYQVGRTGYLAPEDMAFLLALQVVARGVDRAAMAQLVDELAPAQQSMFGAARRLLLPDAADVAARFGGGAGTKGLAASAVEPILASRRQLAPSDLDDHPLVEDEKEKVDPDKEVTYRLYETGTWYWAIIFGGITIFVCAFTGVHLGLVPVAAVVGYLIGRFRPTYACAAPDCQTKMKADDPRCPRCGRRVVRTITHASERLDD